MIWILFIGFLLIGLFVSNRLKKRMRQYAQVPTTSGMSGREIAEKMLRDHNIYDVTVTAVEGELTDHYNPTNKTINLSPEVYHGRHVTAAAIAAHETGHAVQHATAYSMLTLRSKLVPITQISTTILNVVFIGSFLLAGVFSFFAWSTAIWIVIAAQAVITLFALVTLPVEFDASSRALAWLKMSRITRGEEYDMASNGLKWAASTYVVSALSAASFLLYYVAMATGSD